MWVTVEEFEKKLEDEIKGYQLEREHIKIFYENKI